MKRPVIICLIVVLLGAGIIFISATEQGLRFFLSRVSGMVPGLSIDTVSGRLIGPVTLGSARYEAEGTLVTAERVRLDWKPLKLFVLKAHISDIDVSGISVSIRESEKTGESSPGEVPEIRLPLDVSIERASFADITVSGTDGRSLVELSNIVFRSDLTEDTINVDYLEIDSPLFSADIKGQLHLHNNYPLHFTAAWNIRPEGYERIYGNSEISGTLIAMDVKQIVAKPFKARLNAKLYDLIKDFQWEGMFTLEDFRADLLNSEWTAVKASGSTEASGDLSQFRVKGTFDLSEERYGRLSVSLSGKGEGDDYRYTMNALISGRDIPESVMELNGKGSQDGIEVQSLHARLLGGELSGKGSVTWEKGIQWDAEISSSRIDPGMQWAGWQGLLDISGNTSGSVSDDQLNVAPSKFALKGVLRDRPVKGHAELSYMNSELKVPVLELTSGSANITASGYLTDSVSAEWHLDIPDLADLLPRGTGFLRGRGSIKGKKEMPVLKAELKGGGIIIDQYTAGDIGMNVDIDVSDERDSRIETSIRGLTFKDYHIDHFEIKGEGLLSSHRISSVVSFKDRNAALDIKAGIKDREWKGHIKEVLINAAEFGTWSLRDSVSFSVSSDHAVIEEGCILHEDARLCGQSQWDRSRGLLGKAVMDRLDTGMFTSRFPPHLIPEGNVYADIHFSYRQEQKVGGQAHITVPAGKLTYRHEEQDIAVAIEQLHLEAALNEEALSASFGMLLPGRGSAQASALLPSFHPFEFEAEKQVLEGAIKANIKESDIIPLFTDALENTEGQGTIDLVLSGTVAEPEITGNILIEKGSFDIPDMGIKLRDVQIALSGGPEGTDLHGRISSGEGGLQFTGQLHMFPQSARSGSVHIKGENFEVVKIPGTRVVISPDMHVSMQQSDITIKGSLSVPEASVELPDLTGAVPVSKDVIIAGEGTKEPEQTWRIHSDTKLSLGDQVFFRGYGLKGRVEGSLAIKEEPGRATDARGEVRILDGQYKAYGQELEIERGRLIFVGLLDDPGLDIRAVRKIKDVTAGIQASGTLQSPEMSVFSDPSMDQSDALSYLMFGRPMNRLSGSEGEQLHGAASSAALSGAEFAAKKIGAAFGIEEVEIENDGAIEESALVLGKYLSPRLYVSYGIGIFDAINTLRLRYDLTNRWKVQTEYGIESGGDILYTIER